VTATNIRAKRVAAGIAGYAVCRVAGISRARLSDIERENVTATPEDLRRIEAAIDGIIETRRHLARLAEQAGLSLTGVRL
jgi:transcriptional regulator with XRE-family HTH domain